jgi:hypothetical protein
MHRRAILPCLAATSVSLAPAVASAHTRLSGTGQIETSGATLSAWLTSWMRLGESSHGLAILVAGCALAAILATWARRARRMPVVALALMLALTGFETAIHSVHHLGDPRAAEQCLLASSGAHTHAIGGGSPLVADAVTRVLGTVSMASSPSWRSTVAAPTPGRAPPA